MKFLYSSQLFKRNHLIFGRNNIKNLWFVRLCGSGATRENKIVKSPAPVVELPKGNLVETVFCKVDKWWMKTALECSVTGKKVSYSELVEQSERWSGFLKQIGISRNEVVAIIAPNSIQFSPIFYGTVAVGATLSPINWKYTEDEIRKMLDLNKARLIIFAPEVEMNLVKILHKNVKDYHLLCIGQSSHLKATNIDRILYGDLKIQPVSAEKISGEEIAFMPFSSGTTGPPKAVALSHNAFNANINQFSNPYHDAKREWSDSWEEVSMGLLPFFHIYGLYFTLSVGFRHGDKVVVFPHFDKNSFLSNIVKHKINCIHVVPSFLNLLNNDPECNPETMKRLKTVVCGAAPLHASAVHYFKKKIKKHIDFFEAFGMSEVLLTHITPRQYQKIGTCGQLVSNIEGKIIDLQTGDALGPLEEGEMCIKTPSVMKGYVNNPEATKETLRGEWLHTGDIGYYDNEGFFSITDRKKDIIKVQGMQVSPSEIEEHLENHPAVRECSVIGIPDEKTGEVPLAFVVAQKEVTEKELQKLLEKKLSKHKQIRGGVKFVENLPKSETGKILKRVLKTMV